MTKGAAKASKIICLQVISSLRGNGCMLDWFVWCPCKPPQASQLARPGLADVSLNADYTCWGVLCCLPVCCTVLLDYSHYLAYPRPVPSCCSLVHHLSICCSGRAFLSASSCARHLDRYAALQCCASHLFLGGLRFSLSSRSKILTAPSYRVSAWSLFSRWSTGHVVVSPMFSTF